MDKNELLELLKENPNVFKQIEKSPTGLDKSLNQLLQYRCEQRLVQLVKPATINDGIIIISVKDYPALIEKHKVASKQGRFLKFVPASGAASRMFKSISSVLVDYNGLSYNDLAINSDKCSNCRFTLEFIDHIMNFAFYDLLVDAMKKDEYNLDKEYQSGNIALILEYIIGQKGLNLGNMPKGLIPFHKINSSFRTPFHEHLIDAINYIKCDVDTSRLHFTLSDKHIDNVCKHIDDILKMEPLFEGLKFCIEYSTQNRSSDVIAVNPDNTPFLDDEGNVVYRPGGHGALLENINKLDADLIYIRNIDNVATDKLKSETYLFKKLLGGFFVTIEEKIHSFLKKVDDATVTEEDVKTMSDFVKNILYKQLPQNFSEISMQSQTEILFNMLNNPLRVCGMVKNQGEPGGGPFFVKGKNDEISLQIVETSQIDTQDPKQNEILAKSTHFNPVDLVCGKRNYKGEMFDYHNYSDPEMAFIVRKTRFGREYKAIELPGLWNGAMAKWNTVFVETPISTFSPVKTVNDLLRKEHIE